MNDKDFDHISDAPVDDANKAHADSKATSHRNNWERNTLKELVFAMLAEKRASRRWSVFFKFFMLCIVLFGLWMVSDIGGANIDTPNRHTALITINGTIEANSPGGADVVIPALQNAFSADTSVGVVLRINSPGGSPVQAGMINDEIMRLRAQYPGKHLYVVVDEICASGGYYIAAAADKIYVNKASIVGSIGVLMDGFGFSGLMNKLGVERRLLTAGENKGFLDPFSAQSPKHKAYAQTMLNEIHTQFIDVVRKGRGTRLKQNPDVFSGLFWTGAKAVDMGLADGFGTVDSVARDVVKAEDVIDYTEHEGLPERVLKKFGAAVGVGMMETAARNFVPSVR